MRVGLQREAHGVIHEVRLRLDFGVARDVLRHRCLHDGLWFALPRFGVLQALLEFAHRSEILIEPLLVARGQSFLQTPRLIAHEVEDAAAFAQVIDAALDLLRRALHEKPAIQRRRIALRRKLHAIARRGRRAHVILAHAENE